MGLQQSTAASGPRWLRASRGCLLTLRRSGLRPTAPSRIPGASSPCSPQLSFCIPLLATRCRLPPVPGPSPLQLPCCWVLVASWPGGVQPLSPAPAALDHCLRPALWGAVGDGVPVQDWSCSDHWGGWSHWRLLIGGQRRASQFYHFLVLICVVSLSFGVVFVVVIIVTEYICCT